MILRWQSDGTGCSSDPKEAAAYEFVAPFERYTSRINGALSPGEQYRQGVRLLRLTCRAADGRHGGRCRRRPAPCWRLPISPGCARPAWRRNEQRRRFAMANLACSNLIGKAAFAQIKFATDSPLEGTGFELVWGFSCQVVPFGLLPFLCSERKAVLRPVACDQVSRTRGRGRGTETLVQLGGLPLSGACVSQRPLFKPGAGFDA